MITVQVIDPDYDDDLDRSIKDVAVKKLNQESLQFNIKFSDPQSISQNIIEPDLLDFDIKLPQLFVDAETLQPLNESKKR